MGESAQAPGTSGAFSFLVSLMDSVPLPLFVADFSPLKALAGLTIPVGFSYRELFASRPKERDRVAGKVSIIHSNEAGGLFLGASSLPGKGSPPWLRLDGPSWEGLAGALDSLLAGARRAECPINLNSGRGEASLRTLRLELPDFAQETWSHTVVCIVDPASKAWSNGEADLDAGQLFENMTVGFALHEMVFDQEGKPQDYRFLQMNRAFELITGLNRGALLGHLVRDVLPGTEETWIKAYGSVVLTGQPLFVHDYSRELGRWFEVWAYRPSAGRFATMVQDVTEAHDREETIRLQKERLDLALDATGAGLWDLDLGRGTLEVDERWEALLGYGQGSFPGSLGAWEALCHPADLGQASAERSRHLAGESRRYECEIRLRHKDGHYLWFLDRGRVGSRDAEGRPLRMVGTLVNVDRRKLAELAEAEQRTKLSSLLDSLDDMVYFKDREGRYQGVNRGFGKFFGYPVEAFVGKTAADFFSPKQAASIRDQVRLVVDKEVSLRSEDWFTSVEGHRVLLEKKLSPLRDPEGKVVGVAGTSRDVTARYDAEMRSSLRIRVLERARDHGGRALARFALEEVLGLSGSSLGFLYAVDEAGSQASLVAGTASLAPAFALGGREACVDCLKYGPLVRNNLQSETWTAVHSLQRGLFVPLRRGGRVQGILGLARDGEAYDSRDLGLLVGLAEEVWDIVQAKIAEERLAESDRSKEAALELTNAGLWTWHIQEGRREYDGHWARLVGLCPEEADALSLEDTSALVHPDDLAACLAARARHLRGESAIYESELRLHHKDGRWVWVLDRGEVVERDLEGQALRMSGLTVDISRIKATEERLRESVADKEALLRELYHRTNNSMQLVNAMLELKKTELGKGAESRAFEDIQAKIIAMALVQERIYRSGNLSTIDLGDYLVELVDRLKEEELGRGDCPEFRVEVVSVNVAVDAAIPCGIMVSELIGNALHHAFPPGARGQVGLVLGVDPEGSIGIEVWDNGRGLPIGLDPRTSTHLGLRTVIGIGESQLRGRVGFRDRQPGLSVSFVFRNDYLPRRL